ncbi:MAG: CBS domain-containing protein [Thermoplasmata archaeon]|nr:CBS domain-containing protein [Thermoplasmata archaeon]
MKKLKVKDVMDKNPPVAEVPGRREDVLHLFAKHEVSGLAVVKAGTKKFAGIVTRKDIFRNPEEDQLAILMNKEPITISPNASVRTAAKIFYEKKIHGIPVVRKGELVGVVSPRDILKLISRLDGDKIEDYIESPFVPIYEETPLPVVMKIFRITDMPALPVLGSDGKLAGIVSDGDLFNFSLVRERVDTSSIGLGEDEDLWTWEGIRDIMRLYYETSKIELPEVPVKEVMIRNVITVYKRERIGEVARKMIEKDIDQMPVTDENNEIMGMIYDTDLMKALL